jgi:type II secretory pathway pseudopilin PulG
MDQGVGTTQKIVITIAIILGILVILLVGYSLWNKAKEAEAQLAQKEALDAQLKQQQSDASVSITNEANNANGFTFESFTDNNPNTIDTATDTEFAVLATTTIEEEPVATKTTPVVKKKAVVQKKYYSYPTDRPLTAEEIRRIRMLPIDTSATGNLQNKLQTETEGQYQAQYK